MKILPDVSLSELVHTYSHSHMVLPAGVPKCGSCSAVLRRPQETIELSLLLFLSAALIRDLSVPSDSTVSFYIGVCPPACLVSHIIVLAVSAEK